MCFVGKIATSQRHPRVACISNGNNIDITVMVVDIEWELRSPTSRKAMTTPGLVVSSIISIVVFEVKRPASLVGVAIIAVVLAFMIREKHIKCRRREIIAGGVDARKQISECSNASIT